MTAPEGLEQESFRCHSDGCREAFIRENDGAVREEHGFGGAAITEHRPAMPS